MQRSLFLAAVGAAAAAPVATLAKSPPGAPLDVRSAIPVVRARLGGRELLLAIDTGSASSTISPAVAGALGLAHGPLSGVSLAGTTLRDHPVLVAEVSPWRSRTGFDVDGSLGYEAFSDAVVTIDYKNHALRFPETIPDGERAAITWLRSDRRPAPLLTFDGLNVDGFPVTAQFDTSLSKNLIVFSAKLPELLIDDARKEPLYMYEDAQLLPGRVGSVRLGTTTLMASGVVVYEAGAGARAPAGAIGAVAGDGLFARRAVTLDFPNATLIVT